VIAVTKNNILQIAFTPFIEADDAFFAKAGNAFKSTKTPEILKLLLNSKGKDGEICSVAGKYLNGYHQEIFYKEMKMIGKTRKGKIKLHNHSKNLNK
jgi:hypothetical protein